MLPVCTESGVGQEEENPYLRHGSEQD
jgi:hypothetical protein